MSSWEKDRLPVRLRIQSLHPANQPTLTKVEFEKGQKLTRGAPFKVRSSFQKGPSPQLRIRVSLKSNFLEGKESFLLQDVRCSNSARVHGTGQNVHEDSFIQFRMFKPLNFIRERNGADSVSSLPLMSVGVNDPFDVVLGKGSSAGSFENSIPPPCQPTHPVNQPSTYEG
ncbi:hypothetical protein CDAR_424371 [Caerostris darwini]|uniref:C2 NT-type domain-containing protein n=1 Tax=Caerostris darwini TaxID=1538125 RepID=A0AAV4T4B6_9ARAC|nr:hypothetical protein CDAR_424371 [Caerostris darwini]